MIYSITNRGRKHLYVDLEAAKTTARAIHKATGVVVGIDTEDAPYGPMCRNRDACRGKGYCPLIPTCGD